MTKLDESKRASVRASDLLAAAAALAAGTQAYGEVVIFINPDEGEPGHFDWTWGPDGLGGPGTPAQWLDITLPSTDQGGGIGPQSVRQSYYLHQSGYVFLGRNSTSGGAGVAAYIQWDPYYGLEARTLGLLAGESIDTTNLDFIGTSDHASASDSDGPYQGGFLTGFPPGSIRYMGVAFSGVDGAHYGWIGVKSNLSLNPMNLDLDAFAWGYETEPGVPIIAGIPAPGTLAALAFGAVVTRRKRKDD